MIVAISVGFDFSKVKIDRSFLSEMSERPDCAAIVCSINIGQNLNMTTVAEGVETELQLKMLLASGVRRPKATCLADLFRWRNFRFTHELEVAS